MDNVYLLHGLPLECSALNVYPGKQRQALSRDLACVLELFYITNFYVTIK